MRQTGEMKERYGRDRNNHSRAGTPFYKGDSCDDGRDGVIEITLGVLTITFGVLRQKSRKSLVVT